MRIFNDFNVMYNEVERDLKEMGIEYVSRSVQDKKGKFKTKELTNYAYVLTDDKSWEIALSSHQTDKQLAWMWQELEDRIYSDYREYGSTQWNPGRAWELNYDFWRPFLHNGIFSYTYAERWRPQIPKVIQILRERPDSRHGIIEMWNSSIDLKNIGGRKRVPCSMSYQFQIREEHLHANYIMRSCDFHKFFLMDVYMTWCLAKYIADQVGVKMGSLTHFIGSLHAFEEDMKNVF